MGHARRERFPGPQGALFGDAASARPAPYQVKPEHVRNRLIDMLGAMRGVEAWPWSASRTKLFRETVWPYLLALLPEEEAADWRGKLDREAVRLDG